MNEIMDFVSNNGFAIAVAIYLLWERSKFNAEMIKTMKEISTVIKERLPKVSS